MPVLVFDAHQLRCSCVLEIPEWGSLAFDVIKISKLGSLLKAAPALRLPKGSCYPARLRLGRDRTLVDLSAVVASSGRQQVTVRWRHTSREDGDRLEALLRGFATGDTGGSAPHQPRVLQKDGRVNVKATLISRSEAIASDKLLERKRTLRVLQMSSVNSLIEEVVDELVGGLSRSLSAGEREALIDEAKAGFFTRFASLQGERADLEARSRELEEAKAQLEAERRAVVEAHQFTVSDEGIRKLEIRLGRLVDRAVKDGGVTAETEEQMREVMSRLLDEEREKIRSSIQAAQSDAILLLERKIKRLAQNLGDARKERDLAKERAAALEMGSGAGRGNIMQPGLSDDDPRRELKRSLLEELVRDNRWLREQIREQIREQVPPEAS